MLDRTKGSHRLICGLCAREGETSDGCDPSKSLHIQDTGFYDSPVWSFGARVGGDAITSEITRNLLVPTREHGNEVEMPTTNNLHNF